MPTTSPPTRIRWLIFALACAASWLLYLHRYSWGVIKPKFIELNPEITATELGWLDSAFNLTYALGQVPGGLLGDLFGPRFILPVLIIFWALAMAGLAWTHGFWGWWTMRSGFGLAQAGAYPILNKMTRNWFPFSIRTSIQGIVTAMGRIGAACCAPILATLLMGACGLSWQVSLTILMVPGLFLAVALWMCVRNSPREHPWTNAAEQALVADGMLHVGPNPTSPPQPIRFNRGAALSLGMMLLYAFASTFQDQLYVFWIPTFLVMGRDLDPAEMGLFTPLPLIGGAIGGILGGFLNDYFIRRTGNRRWSRTGVAFTGKLVAAGLIWLSVQLESGRWAMVVLLCARIFGDWSLPTQWGAVTDMGGRASATLFGLVNMVGALGGFVAGPVLGFLKQHYGWEGLFGGVAIMCLVAGFTWWGIDCTKRLAAD